MPYVFNTVPKHCDTFDAHPKGKTGVFFAVDVACFQNVWVYHSASKDFEPARVFANIATLSSTNRTADIHFSTGFGKREVGGAQTDLCIFSKQIACEI